MNPDLPQNDREELEIQLTALLLGELPADEATMLREAIGRDAELATLYEQLKLTIGLVRETAATPAEQAGEAPVALRLSDARREKLLAHFKAVVPAQFIQPPRRGRRWLVPTAAAAILVVFVGALGFLYLSHPYRSAISLGEGGGLLENRLIVLKPTESLKLPAGGFAPASPQQTSVWYAVALGDGVMLGGTSTNGRGVAHRMGNAENRSLSVMHSGTEVADATTWNLTPERRPATGSDASYLNVNRGRLSAGEKTESARRPAGHDADSAAPPPAATPRTTIVLPATTPSAGSDSDRGTIGVAPGFHLSSTNSVETQVAESVTAGDLAIWGGTDHFAISGGGVGGGAGASFGIQTNALEGIHQESSGPYAFGGANFDAAGAKPGSGLPSPEVTLRAQFAEITPSNWNNLAFNWDAGKTPAASDEKKVPIFGDVPVFGRVPLTEGEEGGRVGTGTSSVASATRKAVVTAAWSEIPARSSEPSNFDRVNLVGYVDVRPPTNELHLVDEGIRFAAADVERLREESKISDPDPMSTMPTPTLSMEAVRQLQTQLINLEADQVRKEVQLSNLLAMNSKDQRQAIQSALSTPDAQLAGLLSEQDQARQKELALSRHYQAPTPASSNAQQSADDLDKRIDDRTKAVLLGLQNRVESGRAAVDELKQKLDVATATELKRLQAETNAPSSDPAPTKPAASIPVPQPEVQTRDNAFSTFSLNVSDVSFKLAAASLEKGVMPDPAGIRSEEFINALDYRDPEPAAGAPIAFAWERAGYPFAHNRDLLRFSIKTAAQGRPAGRPLNLVLLLDNSGSMERADRVRIIREALRVLASQLQPQDKLSVVVFSRTARLWVDGIPGSQAGTVAEGLSALTPEGGTNLEEAMKLAYETAARHYLAGGINRVVLLTDGAANLGDVDPESLKPAVESRRRQGIALDCFGIGWEGYNDDLLEVLSRNGDGRYGFINTPEEAATEFAGQLAGALRVAASDVKVQVEFNPARVTAYRQIGYAKLQLAKEQFRNNAVDAAEIGAAESGNALYVIAVNPAGEGPVGTVRVRFKAPGTTDYREQEWTVPYTGNAVALDRSSPAMRLAATASAFSEWLATSPYAGEVTTDRLLGCLGGVPEVYGADARPTKLESMIRQAKSLAGK